MRLELDLQKPGKTGFAGTLVWDSESGQLSGSLATVVRERLDEAIRTGRVTTHPYPTEYVVNDPAHDPGEFALVVSMDFVVPADLAEFWPVVNPENAESIPLVY